MKPSYRSRPLICAAACASLGSGGVMVSQNLTNSASASVEMPTLRSRRWTCRVSLSRRRVKAASRRSAPSGDRKDATAASTIAERDRPLRSARSDICFSIAGGKYTFIRSRIAALSQLEAIDRVQRRLPREAAHLLAERPSLACGVFWLVVHPYELVARGWRGCLLHDRDVVGQLG